MEVKELIEWLRGHGGGVSDGADGVWEHGQDQGDAQGETAPFVSEKD